MSETAKQIKRLDARMDSAVVDQIDEGVYEVFVPGAAREVTTVKADSEDEAKEKVCANLLAKSEHTAAKKISTTGNSDGELEIQNSRHYNKAREPEETV